MEKQDSMATITVKEFPDNESYTTEPPPAYRHHKSTAVQVAKIVAVTVVAASAILGACLLASAWIQARATCELMMMEHQLQQAELRAEQDRPSFEALVQDNASDESSSISSTPESTSPEPQGPGEQEHPNQENDVQKIKLPLQLDFDDLAGSLMERNQRAHMNCVVEKRRSEELVDHAPRALRLPFGLNLTTPPRLEHLTGERMVIRCESGNDQNRQMPMPHAPVMIPLPGQVHMPMNYPMPHPPQHDVPHHPEMAAMIFEHHNAPVPLSAMAPPPPPQHHEQHEQHQPEGRAFHGFPIPIQIHEMIHENDDQQRDESSGEARLFPGIPMPVQIRQINVHEQPQQLRPHYVQPRSVPSNPDFLGKRVKRCACNCDC